MSLATYKKKRSFSETPEPSGKEKKTGGRLRFVVQEHAASHLHYDFRLEMKGVLKSWAVPKGPSMDPKVKRLAMMVEDHPYDYRLFEGIIPAGNYGAGTVIVWDEGYYEPLASHDADKNSQEKILLKELNTGSLKFVLHGEKLKGEFALVKTKGLQENAWLLIKHKDKYQSPKDITLQNKSAKSGKTLEQVASSSKHIYGEKAKKKNTITGSKTRKKEQDKSSSSLDELLARAKTGPFPKNIKPMLATLTEEPFSDPGWIYEVKWDGYRAIGYVYHQTVEIRSRNNLMLNDKFKPVADALKKWTQNAVLDGEIVAIDAKGHADFQQLQGYQKGGGKAHIVYYVFDLIWYEGKNLVSLPLIERKEILRKILPDDQSVIRFSDHIKEHGSDFFKVATREGLEGIMAKKSDSEYIPDFRSRNWLKIKNNHQLEAIICGFTKPRNSRQFFGAVILGRYEGAKLKYIGHSGSGFDQEMLKELYGKFQPLITDDCPFEKAPKTNMPVTWLKPKMVCTVKFTEWTSEKILRHPIFTGLREDKKAANEKNVRTARPPRKTSSLSVKNKK